MVFKLILLLNPLIPANPLIPRNSNQHHSFPHTQKLIKCKTLQAIRGH